MGCCLRKVGPDSAAKGLPAASGRPVGHARGHLSEDEVVLLSESRHLLLLLVFSDVGELKGRRAVSGDPGAARSRLVRPRPTPPGPNFRTGRQRDSDEDGRRGTDNTGASESRFENAGS